MTADSQVSVVFGATGGIGGQLTELLASRGDQLALSGSSREKLDDLRDRFGCLSETTDVNSWESIQEFLKRSHDQFGRIDAVALCVGSILLKPAHSVTLEEWEKTLALNLSSAFAVIKFAAPLMRKTGGSIVLVSSSAARVGIANHEAIAAAKAGLHGLSISAAATYAPQRIRVNCVAPGLTDTPMAAPILSSPAAREVSEKMHPLGGIGTARAVADAISWLMDRNQSWVTGQIIGVDGGLSSLKPRNG